MARLYLAFSLVMVGAMQQPRLASPTSLATAFWEQLQAVSWDTGYGEWYRLHPTVGCQQHSSDPAEASKPDELWSYRCQQGVGQTQADWVFYAFNVRDPVIAQLSRFDATASGPPLADMEAAQDSLSVSISAGTGRPRAPLSSPQLARRSGATCSDGDPALSRFSCTSTSSDPSSRAWGCRHGGGPCSTPWRCRSIFSMSRKAGTPS
jgi:hypothetical protein